MSDDRHGELQRWADRGHPRGAATLLEQVDARLAHSDQPSVELRPVRPRRRWAAALAAAVLVAVVIGLVVLIDPLGNERLPMVSEPAPVATTVPGSLSETATCSPGQNPNDPGSVDQARPPRAINSGRLAAFDSRSGRIVMIAEGQTWSLDVCSNTWEQMQTAPGDYVNTVVYDADSDLIIAFVVGFDPVEVWAYDLESNTWSKKQNPGDEIRARSTLYDPVTGLIVTDRHDERLATYDVDRDQWETIPIDLGFQTVKGKRPGDPGGVLLAYHPGLDKIVSWGHPMAIIDLRSGEVQIDSEPFSPSLVSGYAPPLRYAQDSESGRGIIHDFGGGALWAYDPTQPGWELIYGLSEDFETGPGAVGIRIYDAMVYDTINGRLVVIGGRVKIDGEWETIDDVWAFDIDSEEWTELVPASHTLDSE